MPSTSGPKIATSAMWAPNRVFSVFEAVSGRWLCDAEGAPLMVCGRGGTLDNLCDMPPRTVVPAMEVARSALPTLLAAMGGGANLVAVSSEGYMVFSTKLGRPAQPVVTKPFDFGRERHHLTQDQSDVFYRACEL